MLNMEEQQKALQIAIQTERNGYQYYKESMSRTQNPLLKETLYSLAQDEIQHEKFITRFYENLTGNLAEEQLALVEEESAMKSEVDTIFRKALKNPGEQVELSETDREIYAHSIEFEKKGVSYYAELEAKSEDDITRKFFRFLKEMEEMHLDILQRSVQFLENPQQYYSENENWILEG